MNKNLLITGCSGFIGFNTVIQAISDGNFVIGIDNLESTYDSNLKSIRLKELNKLKNFEFIHKDIKDKDIIKKIIDEKKIDCIINLAAKAGVRKSISQPSEYYQTNLMNTLNILDVLKLYPHVNLIQASTSSVYGNTRGKFSEDNSSINQISPYASSKKAAEDLCYVYSHIYNLKITILRFFTVFGPYGRPDMSIFRFIHWIYQGEPLKINGDGEQERDFTYVGDVVSGILSSIESSWEYEIINLGSDHPYSINYVIKLIENYFGINSKKEYGPPDPSDIRSTQASIGKAKIFLNWSPSTSIEEGIIQTCKWYEENEDWAKKLEY